MASGSQLVTLKTHEHYVRGAGMNELKVGDTICCHDYSDMRDVQRALLEQGYKVTIDVGYTVRITSVPDLQQTEQDGW